MKGADPPPTVCSAAHREAVDGGPAPIVTGVGRKCQLERQFLGVALGDAQV